MTAEHFAIVAAYTADPTNLDLVEAEPDAAQRADLKEAQRVIFWRHHLLNLLESVVEGREIDLGEAGDLLRRIRRGA